MTIEAIIARYGVLAVFLGAGLEGETVVVSGGLLAHRGLLPLVPTMAAAATGSFVADQIFFLLGRRFRDHPRVRGISAKPAFARALAMLERHPVAFVLAFRFLYGLRTVSPIAIGTTALPASRFVLLNAIAAVLWGIVFTAIGYAFGHGIELAFGRLRSIGHVAAAVGGITLVLLILGWLVRRWWTGQPTNATRR